MKTVNRRIYEGMFLVDSAEAASDWDGVNAAIDKIFERSGAEVLYKKKWDESRLAYEIDGRNRGTYFLTYFKVDGDKIADIERDVNLSEKILRVLVLRGDHVNEEVLGEETPAEVREKKEAERAEAAESNESESQEEARSVEGEQEEGKAAESASSEVEAASGEEESSDEQKD